MVKIVVCNQADKCVGHCNHKAPHAEMDSCKDFYCKCEKKYGCGCKALDKKE